MPPPDPELRRLDPLLGTWKSEEQTQDSLLGPGVRVSNTETFHYWGYDSEAGRFRIIFFSNNGPFTEDGNRYEGEVGDGTLTFEGPARFQYELDGEGRVKVNPDGTISVAWWLRGENGGWEPWMQNTFAKVKHHLLSRRR